MGSTMGVLYDLAQQVTGALALKHDGDSIGLVLAKGELATRTGFLVALITPSDPDDPAKVHALREAARDLGIAV